MKVNEKRKQMYHKGEVGIQYNADNSGNRLEMLRQITDFESIGTREQYWHGDTETFQPLSWFFEPDTERKPTAWRLKIDVPEYRCNVGDIIILEPSLGWLCNGCRFNESFLPHIATPIYTTPFTIESGQVVELSETDINNIKQLP